MHVPRTCGAPALVATFPRLTIRRTPIERLSTCGLSLLGYDQAVNPEAERSSARSFRSRMFPAAGKRSGPLSTGGDCQGCALLDPPKLSPIEELGSLVPFDGDALGILCATA